VKISMSGKMYDRRPLEEAIEAAARIGYTGIELRGREDLHLSPSTPKGRLAEIKRLLADSGLRATAIASFSGGYGLLDDSQCQRQYEDFCRHADQAQELGCPQVRHWSGWKASRTATREQWERAVLWLRKAAEYAQARGVTVCVEIHHDTYVDTNARALKTVRDVGMPNVGIIHDAANLYHDSAPYGADVLPELAGVLVNVHCKDVVALNDDSHPEAFAYNGRYFRHCLINRGGVDQHSVFRGLQAMGYAGYVTVESGGLLTPFELAEDSYQQVKSMLEKYALPE
jgi:L-ribulose-5-phosphate 3-epimerase